MEKYKDLKDKLRRDKEATLARLQEKKKEQDQARLLKQKERYHARKSTTGDKEFDNPEASTMAYSSADCRESKTSTRTRKEQQKRIPTPATIPEIPTSQRALQAPNMRQTKARKEHQKRLPTPALKTKSQRA